MPSEAAPTLRQGLREDAHFLTALRSIWREEEQPQKGTSCVLQQLLGGLGRTPLPRGSV